MGDSADTISEAEKEVIHRRIAQVVDRGDGYVVYPWARGLRVTNKEYWIERYGRAYAALVKGLLRQNLTELVRPGTPRCPRGNRAEG